MTKNECLIQISQQIQDLIEQGAEESTHPLHDQLNNLYDELGLLECDA